MKDLTTDESMEKFRQDSLQWAKDTFTKKGQLIPTALLLATIDPEGNEIPEGGGIIVLIYGGGDFTDKTKSEWTNYIRKIASDTAAIAVVTLSEAWAATYKADPVKGGFDKAPKGSLEFVPGRKEVLMASFENKKSGNTIWMAEITRDGEKPHVAEFINPYLGSSATGKFTRLLPCHNLDMS